jgi:hypothetical protein
MVLTEYVLKNFVDNHETQDQINRSASPVEPEILGVRISSPLIHRIQEAETQNLKSDVGKENWKRTVKFVAQHRGTDPQLQDGVGDPECELVVSGHQPVSSASRGATVDGTLS